MTTSVIVAGARTPIGKLLGTLSDLTAPQLGGTVVHEALDRAHIPSTDVEAVFMGNVVQAGVGPNPARQAALAGGVPLSVPATTVNKLCLSGIAALAQADQAIRAGQHKIVLAGGMESMSRAPHLALGARTGYKYGPGRLVDALDQDALHCAIDGELMGAATERYQRQFGFSRTDLDEFSAGSHEKAAAAAKNGNLTEEIVPVTVRTRTGERVVEYDEGVRPETTVEQLGRLRSAFAEDGLITAGSSSQLSDGACALVVMDKSEAQRRGIDWLAEIVSYGTVAGPDPSLLLQPAHAIRDAMHREGRISVHDLDVVEINEAFAGVALASRRELGIAHERLNPNGGAIALGHPVGMSGARIALSLALELRRRGGGTGAAALCGGGGQGDALILRVAHD
ncbi:acetyl-CoA C-acyltransferase [Rhodococcus sp. NPDC003383]